MLGPFTFIPHAESTGLIIPLGYWIAKQACQFQKLISSQHDEQFFTIINLSGKQFGVDDIVTKLIEIVYQYAASPDGIKFEITESLLMSNPELARQSLEELKQSGVKLAIDDFGTGYSSLS